MRSQAKSSLTNVAQGVALAFLMGGGLAVTWSPPNAGATVRHDHNEKTNLVVAQAGITQHGKYTSVTMAGPTVDPPDVANLTENVAYSDGYFRRNHLKVTMVESGSGPLGIAGLESGREQFAITNPEVVAAADAQGAGIVTVAAFNFQFPSEILAQRSVKHLTELEKVPVGGSPGARDEEDTSIYLQAKGIRSSAVDWANTGSTSATDKLLVGGRLGACWVTAADAVTLLREDPKLHVLVSTKQFDSVVQNYGATVNVLKSYAAKHPRIVEEFTAAIIESNRRLYGHEATFINLSKKLLPKLYSTSELKDLYSVYRSSYGVNGGFVPSVTTATNRSFERAKPNDTHNKYFKNISALMDPAFARRAVARLGVIRNWPDADVAEGAAP